VTSKINSQTIKILHTGQLELVGQFTWGSNYTFLVKVKLDGEEIEAVYKPRRGERPLWDFPDETLAGREVAAYMVSEALGWDLVPPTVFREDGPYGAGSLQLRVDHDSNLHYFNFDEATRQRLRPAALFDLLVNNADRKGGHILLDKAGKIWLIDHGVCFHTEPKLRTVVWDFVGEPIPEDLLDDIRAFASGLDAKSELRMQLAAYLSEEEIGAMQTRAKELLSARHYPAIPEDQRAVPWPLV
jgi:hypothetical protein